MMNIDLMILQAMKDKQQDGVINEVLQINPVMSSKTI